MTVRIHAPEGSWLTWPWAHTALVGEFVIAASAVTGWSEDEILAHTPALWLVLNLALFVGIGVRLQFSMKALSLSLLAFALSPIVVLMHAFYRIDHHIVELSFILGSVFAGLSWVRSVSPVPAVALAALLGLAPAFHNGLCVLQIPILAIAFILWSREVLRARVLRPSVRGCSRTSIIHGFICMSPA